MLRSGRLALLWAGLVVATLAPRAGAQGVTPDATIILRDGWAIFETRCKLAMEDLQGFVASVPPQGPAGVPAFSQSPDQQILAVQEWHGGWTLEAYVSAAGGLRMTHCAVHGWDAMAEDDSAYVAALAAAVTAHFTSRPDLPLTGGVMPRSYVQMHDGQTFTFADMAQHHFASAVAWGGATLPVFISVANAGYDIHVVKMEGAGS
jgi:hypothetical protein